MHGVRCIAASPTSTSPWLQHRRVGACCPLPHPAVSYRSLGPFLTRQTVRWRFARAPPGKTRRGVLYHLIRNDVFDLRSAEAGKGGGLLGPYYVGAVRGGWILPPLRHCCRDARVDGLMAMSMHFTRTPLFLNIDTDKGAFPNTPGVSWFHQHLLSTLLDVMFALRTQAGQAKPAPRLSLSSSFALEHLCLRLPRCHRHHRRYGRRRQPPLRRPTKARGNLTKRTISNSLINRRGGGATATATALLLTRGLESSPGTGGGKSLAVTQAGWWPSARRDCWARSSP